VRDPGTLTLIDELKEQAEARPDQIAFVVGDDSWTYRRLAESSDCVARALAARGVESGDRVVLHMSNAAEMIVSYYACFRIGAIAAPLHVRLKTSELLPLLQRLQPAAYLGQEKFYSEAAAIGSDTLAANARFIAGGWLEDGRARRWEDLLDGAESPIVRSPDISTPAVLLMTSGTTGVPKFVMHTHGTLAAATDAASRLGFDAEQVALQNTTMAHISGLWLLLASIRFGVPLVVPNRFDPDAVLDAIESQGCSWMLYLPFMSSELIRCQRRRARDVGSLRTCIAVGDVCPRELQQEFQDVFGVPLRSVWASTETAAPFSCGLEPGPVSRIATGTHVRLVDDNDKPVPRGEAGEMLIRTPGMAAGYWSGRNRVEDLLVDGWFRTGDVMRQGDGDDLWFVSRKKELLVRGGDNISPVEVEQVLIAHPAVRDAAVTGVPDATLGQRVVALIQLQDDVGAVLDDIRARTATQLAAYKVPEQMYVVKGIPKNPLGKTDRRTLAAIASAYVMGA
jgi:long-chain acyl-CoA synthetase